MTTDVYLIRHGESYSNLEHRLVGRPPGPGLTLLGRAQATAVAALLLSRGVRPTLVLSSPLRRTRETAKPLLDALYKQALIVPQLRETRFGAWEGVTVASLADDPQFKAWLEDPEGAPPPGGERLSHVQKRVGVALERAANRESDGTIVAYSHMHALLGFALQVLEMPFAQHKELVFRNCSLVHVRYSSGRWRMVETFMGPEIGSVPEITKPA